MKKLKLDTGVVSYELGQGVLQFNPTDPNVYMRFQQALEQLTELEKNLKSEQGDLLSVMSRLDKTIKEMLNGVFGPGNDFDAICGGVSLFAADEKGQRLLEKLLRTLEPVLLEGARQCARQ